MSGAAKAVHRDIKAHILWLEKRLKDLDTQITQWVKRQQGRKRWAVPTLPDFRDGAAESVIAITSFPVSGTHLLGGPTAVDRERGTCDVAGVLATQPERDRGHVSGSINCLIAVRRNGTLESTCSGAIIAATADDTSIH